MAEPEEPAGGPAGEDAGPALPPRAQTPLPPSASPQRYGRYAALLGLLLLVLITINTIVTRPNGARGVPVGEQVPPFAAPLAAGNLEGAVNVATGPNQGQAGSVPACSVRKPGVLNICELYEQGPVVLALFVQSGSCTDVAGRLQALSRAHPAVRFAAVAIRGERGPLRKLIARQGLTYPVGIDSEGTLAALYRVASCPQVSFISRGGRVQAAALLGGEVTAANLAARVQALEASSQQAGAGAAGATTTGTTGTGTAGTGTTGTTAGTATTGGATTGGATTGGAQ